MTATFPHLSRCAETSKTSFFRTVFIFSLIITFAFSALPLWALQHIIVSVKLPQASLGAVYNGVVSVTGGSAPYQFSVSGSLPPGLSLNATTGTISGTPSKVGTYSFSIEVTDLPHADHGGLAVSIVVVDLAGVTVTLSPSSATVSSGAHQQFTAMVRNTSNTAVTWSATAGYVSHAGDFKAPTVYAPSTATITATSAADPAKKGSTIVSIQPAASGSPFAITTSWLATASVGIHYSAPLAASGGIPPYTWKVVSGTLPSGITMSGAGGISGTASAAGQYTVTVQASDSYGIPHTASTTLALTVEAAGTPAAEIDAVFPPMGTGNQYWTAFNTYVLSSPLLDGVNPGMDWGDIETSQGVYNFATFDNEIQHFIDYGKKVNIIVRPVTNGGVNVTTPPYVFTQAWATSHGAAKLSIVSCANYPGNGLPNTAFPVVYQPSFKAAYKKFMAAVIAHYANNPHIGYIRFGLAVGGETYPWCNSILPGYSETTWLDYVNEMVTYQKSLQPTMRLLLALNNVFENNSWNASYGTGEAAIAVSNGLGIGTEGWKQGDIAAYNAGLSCAGDWCVQFDHYAGQVPLELQQAGPSNANGGTTFGALSDMIPFAMAHHASVYEIYVEDLLTAFDPNWPAYAQYGSAYRQAITNAHQGTP
jgi:hypothetical protein